MKQIMHDANAFACHAYTRLTCTTYICMFHMPYKAYKCTHIRHTYICMFYKLQTHKHTYVCMPYMCAAYGISSTHIRHAHT